MHSCQNIRLMGYQKLMVVNKNKTIFFIFLAKIMTKMMNLVYFINRDIKIKGAF